MIEVRWRPRDAPLSAVAVAAVGAASRALAEKLLRQPNVASQLRGVIGDDLLILLGEASLLPWIDGAVYLGKDGRAPSLLVPTTLECSIPLALLERALLAKAGTLSPPLAVVHAPSLLASVAEARPVERSRIESFITGAR